MRNVPIMAGLCDVGRHDLEAELAWSTIRTFNTNYTEYIVPSTGAGEGVSRYGWSASQYIQCVIESLFGAHYDRLSDRVRLFPHVPRALLGQRLVLERLILPTGGDTRLRVELEPVEPGRGQVQWEFEGRLPKGGVEVWLPADGRAATSAVDGRGKRLLLRRGSDEITGVSGVWVKAARKERVRFE
jgi:hypothetical protein